jgi:hypothetical protein
MKEGSGKIRTALHFAGVARVGDTAIGRANDEEGHGGNGKESELGEHFVGGELLRIG